MFYGCAKYILFLVEFYLPFAEESESMEVGLMTSEISGEEQLGSVGLTAECMVLESSSPSASPDMLLHNAQVCNHLGLVAEVENVQIMSHNEENNSNNNNRDNNNNSGIINSCEQINQVSGDLEQILGSSGIQDSGKQITDILKLLSASGQIQGIQLTASMVNDASTSSANVFEARGTRAAEILSCLSDSGQIQDIQIGSFAEGQNESNKSSGNILYLTSPSLSSENFTNELANIASSSLLQVNQSKNNPQNTVEVSNSEIVLQVQNPLISMSNESDLEGISQSSMLDVSQNNVEMMSSKIVLHVEDVPVVLDPDKEFTVSSSLLEPAEITAPWSTNVQSSHKSNLVNPTSQLPFISSDKNDMSNILKDITADADICRCNPCRCNPSQQECQNCGPAGTENLQEASNHSLNRKRKNVSISEQNAPSTSISQENLLENNGIFEYKKLALVDNSKVTDAVDTLLPTVMQDVNSITLTESSVPNQLYKEADSLPVSSTCCQKSGGIMSSGCKCCGKNSEKSCGVSVQNNRDPCCVVVCLKTLEALKKFLGKGCCSGAENSLYALARQMSERSSCCSEKHK